MNIDDFNLPNGTYVIGSATTGNKPFDYGFMIQFKRFAYKIQIAIDIDSGKIAKRQGLASGWASSWYTYVTNSDKNVHTLNLTGYKYILVLATFPNAGSSGMELYVPFISQLPHNITLTNGHFSNNVYYGAMNIRVSSGNIQTNHVNVGSGINAEPYYDVYGLQ